MRTRPLHAVAAAAAITLAAAPLSAQRVNVVPQGTARVVATYDIRSVPRDKDFPVSVTVSDSAGTILAHVALTHGTRTVPMTVTVIESSLVLQGETPDGLLTLVLDGQNEGGAVKLDSGTWTLGRAQGRFRAITPR